MLTVEKIREIVTKVGKKYGIKNAYLFGSYAKGLAKDSSDIDIIVDLGEIETYNDFADFRRELEEKLGTTDIDLLTTDGVKPRFYNLIKNDQVLLYGA